MSSGTRIGNFIGVMLLTIVVGGALLFSAWQLASTPVPPDTERLSRDVAFLASDLDSARLRLQRLQARQEVLERETEILRQANRLLQEQESQRQGELVRLQSELDFYRRLARAGGVQEGLDAFRTQLTPTDSTRVFRFILTLTQNIRDSRVVKGAAKIAIEGTRQDRPVTLDWGDVNDGRFPNPVFEFKYFQQLEGYLTLPEGFSPTRLLLRLEPDNGRATVLKSYDWHEILTEQSAGN